MLRFIKLLVFLLNGTFLFSQELLPSVERLNQLPGTVNTLYHSVHRFLKPGDLPPQFNKTGQQFIKLPQHLYLCLDGTGRVYELIDSNSKTKWQRVDSTQFFGYNFNCIYFGYKNELYSFGGYGYWRRNGHLRKFNHANGDWELISLEEEVPFVFEPGESFFYLDNSKGRMYISNRKINPDESMKNPHSHHLDNKLIYLDLNSRRWEVVGDRTEIMSGMNLATSHGIFTADRVLNIEKNEVYTLSESLSNEIKSLLGRMNRTYGYIEIYYSHDSTIYLGNSQGFLDSIVLHQKDLLPTTQKIYSSGISPNWYWSLLLLLPLGLGFVNLKNRKKVPQTFIAEDNIAPSQQIVSENEMKEVVVEVPTGNDETLQCLDDRERQLYLFILQKTNQGESTTVEEINQLIGCIQRNMEVQKRMRSDIIISINTKLKNAWGIEGVVIDKKRAEFDKRSYEYFVATGVSITS